MRQQSHTEKELEREIYVQRLLVFLEGDDGFRQVRLTKEMFKKLSDACVITKGVPGADGLQTVQLSLDERVLPKGPFDLLPDFYSAEEFESSL